MNADLTINGLPASTYGIMFEYGTLEQLLTPPETKAVPTNSSRHQNGVQIDARSTKINAREVELPIILSGASEDDYFTKYEALMTLLISGNKGSGIIELGCERYLWRLHFVSCDTIRIFADAYTGRFLLTFLEPDPTNNQHPEP